MEKLIKYFLIISALGGSLTAPAYAADAQTGTDQRKNAVAASQLDPYRQQMKGLIEELKDAKTPEQRKEIQGRIEQARQAYSAAHPVKEITPAEKAASRQKMEADLKKDPYRWEMYQLRQSMMAAGTAQEREVIQAKIKDLSARHAAEEEAKLTPEQRAAAQARRDNNARIQAELKPLNDQMQAARTAAERKAVQERIQAVLKKIPGK